MPNKKQSTVTLTNRKILAEAKVRQHFVVLDEPVDAGGFDSAPTPVEYLLTAVGGCVAMTLRMYAQRKNWDLGEIKVDVKLKEELTSEGVKKSLVEDISFEKEITDDQRSKLMEIAGKCPVAKIVKGETLIETKAN